MMVIPRQDTLPAATSFPPKVRLTDNAGAIWTSQSAVGPTHIRGRQSSADNVNRSDEMITFKQAIVAGAVALLAAMSVTSAHASAKLCQKILGRQCSKRAIGKDLCFQKCERAWMNCG
jgi:hypothetical protein